MSRDIFSMGACVRVDPSSTSQGGIGFVTALHTEERKVDVNYNENSIGIINSSPFIDEGRLHAQSFDLIGAGGGGTTRSGRRHIAYPRSNIIAITVTKQLPLMSPNSIRVFLTFTIRTTMFCTVS